MGSIWIYVVRLHSGISSKLSMILFYNIIDYLTFNK